MAGEQLHLIAGMNLPLVIEWLNSQMNCMDSDYITAGKAGMVDISKMLAKIKTQIKIKPDLKRKSGFIFTQIRTIIELFRVD